MIKGMSLLFSWIVQAAMWVYTGVCYAASVFSFVTAGVLVAWYLAVCCAVGFTAARYHGRRWWRWFFLALFVTPGLALLFLMARARSAALTAHG